MTTNHHNVPCACSNGFTMEGWLHFVIRYSPVVFQSAHVPPFVFQLWRQLRSVVMHFCLPPAEILMSDEERRAAIEDDFQEWRKGQDDRYTDALKELDEEFSARQAVATDEFHQQQLTLDQEYNTLVKTVKGRSKRGAQAELQRLHELHQQRATLEDAFERQRATLEHELQEACKDIEQLYSVRLDSEEKQRECFSRKFWAEWAEDRVKEGARLSKEFASELEKAGFPSKMFTSNLHLVCCRCGQQCVHKCGHLDDACSDMRV
jgi:hypothetical protein